MKHITLEFIGLTIAYLMGVLHGITSKLVCLMLARDWKELKDAWRARRSSRG